LEFVPITPLAPIEPGSSIVKCIFGIFKSLTPLSLWGRAREGGGKTRVNQSHESKRDAAIQRLYELSITNEFFISSKYIS
jgi:hypothetical protein